MNDTRPLRERVTDIIGPGEPETATLMALVDFVEESARDTGWSTMPLADLCGSIIQRHHGYLRDVLPRLSNRTSSAATQRPEYGEMARIFSGFRMDLEAHMAKEETTFFPQMANLERNLSSNGALRPSVAGPIGFLEAEHEEAVSSLAAMERLTCGFTPKEGDGSGVRLLLAELAILDEDMRWHVHKENEVLFPRARALERSQTAEVW